MRVSKPLLLATTTVLTAAALPASGADLPMSKSQPVEYVRVCTNFGEGFFFIPGSDTCLRIGGRLRAEYRYLQPGNRLDDATGMRARSRLNIDARTPTSYGTLRTFIRYEVTADTGVYGDAVNFNLYYGFIQFSGLTAGKQQSFFDFYQNDFNYGTLFVSDFQTPLLAYTATLGSGLTATLSLEDNESRNQIAGPNGPGAFPGQGFSVAGERMPDVVGQLRLEQSWGVAQLSGALHQLRSANYMPGAAPRPFVDTDYGFAIQGGLKLNLPMIAAGDQLWLQGGYTNGAMSYLGMSNSSSIGAISLNQSDVYVDALGDARRSRGWAATALMVHYWTPQIWQTVFGSYARNEYPGAATVIAPTGAAIGFVPTADLRVGTNINWSPARNFYIGAEVLYRRVDPRGRVYADDSSGRTVSSADGFETRLRLQRDF